MHRYSIVTGPGSAPPPSPTASSSPAGTGSLNGFTAARFPVDVRNRPGHAGVFEDMRLIRARLTAMLTTLLTALLLTAGTLAGVASAQPATSMAPTGVPWSHVGTGWVLTQYTT